MQGLILTESGYKLVKAPRLQNFPLRNNVSTDEIYPVKYCFYFKRIGRFALTGDRFGQIPKGFLKKNKIKFIIAGENFGCGSAREHAAITFKDAGVELIYAYSFNKTFADNCANLDLYTTTYEVVLKRYLSTRKIPKKLIRKKLAPVKKIGNKPMTIVEKIINRHLLENGKVFLDLRFSYEIFTPLIAEILKRKQKNFKKITRPDSIYLFEDHFLLSHNPTVKSLLRAQRLFAKKAHVRLISFGSKESGICHAVLRENFILPGQIVIGTDSHTSSGGALNALCFGVGATTMAQAIINNQLVFKTPPTVRINFEGRLSKKVMAKDVILYLFTEEIVKSSQAVGCVLEFGGEGLKNFSVDELSVLTNMAVEAGALTGIVEPQESVLNYLAQRRKLSKKYLKNLFVYSDKGAEYQEVLGVALAKIEPMIALPPSPLKVIPLSMLSKKIKINKAFLGSCTGGKLEDLRQAAKILEGRKIKKWVELVVHPASTGVAEQMKKEGLDKIFLAAGGKIYPSVCGACCGQGPGRVAKGEVVISSSNRNYHGRMGEGEAYLANPRVVASSALQGFISSDF